MNPLYYSEVDMKGDNGNGEIIIKNCKIYSPVQCMMAGIRHSNKEDMWAIFHDWGSENYLSFLITKNGISKNPIKTKIGYQCSDTKYNFYSGTMKISPVTKKIVSTINEISGFELLDFDNSTGIFSNLITVNYSENTTLLSSSFSPDGSKLYIISNNNDDNINLYSSILKQYNTKCENAQDLENSEILIDKVTKQDGGIDYTDMQIGIDGKIYLVSSNTYVSVIQNPNNSGDSCYLEPGKFHYPTRCNLFRLPNFLVDFLTDFNYRILSNSPICEGGEILLFGDNISSKTYNWSGPEKFVSSEKNPIIKNATTRMSGDYYLKTDNSNFKVSIFVDSLPKVKIKVKGSTSLCEGESSILQAEVSGASDYWWSNDENSPEIAIRKGGLYKLFAVNSSGCIDSSSVIITLHQKPNPILFNLYESEFCDGESTVLTTKEKYGFYQWSNGETKDSIRISKSGFYYVEVTDSNGCKGYSDPINIIVNPSPSPKISGPNSVCLNTEHKYRIFYLSNMKTDWNINNGILTDNSGDSLIIISWGTKGTGRIIITQTDTTTDCKGSDYLDIIINDTLKPNITATSNKLCKGGFVLLSAPIGYTKYRWNTGDTTREITVTKEGEYYVWVQDAGDCVGTSDKIIISEVPLPIPVIVGDTLLCFGKTNLLSVQQNFVSYLWNTGETTKQINITQQGNYSVEVVDTNGCRATADFTVKEFQFKLSGNTDLDFGKTKIGIPTSKKLALKNESNSEIRISKITTKSNSPEFTIITNPAIPATLKINETIEIEISFNPKESKHYQDSVIVESDSPPCLNNISSLLKGEAGVKTLVWLPDTSGKVGETDFCIPLRSNFVESYTQKLSYSAKIRFDATAFLPDSIYKSYILGTDRFVELSDSNIHLSEKETKLGEFCGTILLADNDRTPLYIDDFEWSDSGIETEKKDGSLTLTGLCVRNLSRLKLLITDEITLSPNPAEDYLILNSKIGQGKIEIFSALGIKLIETEYKEKIDVSELPSGLYFVRVGNKVGKFVKI